MRETWKEEDGRLIIRKDFLVDDDRAARLRDAQAPMSDSWHVGSIPLPILSQWFKEAGVEWHDKHACQEVIRAKLISGDFQKFRVKEGRF